MAVPTGRTALVADVGDGISSGSNAVVAAVAAVEVTFPTVPVVIHVKTSVDDSSRQEPAGGGIIEGLRTMGTSNVGPTVDKTIKTSPDHVQVCKVLFVCAFRKEDYTEPGEVGLRCDVVPLRST